MERGFLAEAVREPEGAIDYNQADEGWDDFDQKARMGKLNEEIQPPEPEDMEGIIYPGVAFSSLLEAANIISSSETPGKQRTYDGASDYPVEPHPRSLSLLADAALSEPPPTHLPQMQTSLPPHRTPYPPPHHLTHAHAHHSHGHPGPPGPTHGPTDPRSFILPRPTPTQQPRRLLPARGQLGLGLPDPFAMTGPPQLPPPPGSNFARLPLPGGYLPPPSGHPPPPPSLYFPPPPPGSHAPPPPPRRY